MSWANFSEDQSVSQKPHKNPILEATKVQARAVIPIVKELEKELGKERAHAIVGRAIAANYVAWRESRGFVPDAHPRAEAADGPDFPVEHQVVEDTATAYGHNITGCAFADFTPFVACPMTSLTRRVWMQNNGVHC